MTPGKDVFSDPVFNKTVTIDAPPAAVWAMLTDPTLMRKWMSEAVIDIITDWKVGNPVVIRGALYKKPFENTGTVLVFEPSQMLEYTHLSSLSRLPDVPGNHCRISFGLKPFEGKTNLTLDIRNFPTETIYRHLAFYWNVAIEILKRSAEDRRENPPVR